jgi:hypothetical protein
MKPPTISILPLLLSLVSANINIPTFEEHFINALPTSSSSDPSNATSITLVGFKAIPIAAEHLAQFEEDYYANVSLWGNNRVYDPRARAVRVYFPVAGALLALGVNGEHVEADLLGRIVVSGNDNNDNEEDHIHKGGSGLHVLGRKRTERITGVEGNIVKDDIIYLSEPAQPVRQVGRAFIYDFGTKQLHSHSHPHPHADKRAEEEGKKGCLQNHNGINCSKAYGINHGRCPMNTKTCMDYNGIVTDCKNYSSGWKKYRNFVGSDCDTSLGRGHCWNEVM